MYNVPEYAVHVSNTSLAAQAECYCPRASSPSEAEHGLCIASIGARIKPYLTSGDAKKGCKSRDCGKDLFQFRGTGGVRLQVLCMYIVVPPSKHS